MMIWSSTKWYGLIGLVEVESSSFSLSFMVGVPFLPGRDISQRKSYEHIYSLHMQHRICLANCINLCHKWLCSPASVTKPHCYYSRCINKEVIHYLRFLTISRRHISPESS